MITNNYTPKFSVCDDLKSHDNKLNIFKKNSKFIGFLGNLPKKNTKALNEDCFEIKFSGKNAQEELNFIFTQLNSLKKKVQASNPENISLKLNNDSSIALIKSMFNKAEKFLNENQTKENKDIMTKPLYEFVCLTYKNLDKKGKIDLENKLLDIIKTTKNNEIMKLGTDFFFEIDEHKDKDFKKLTDIVKKINSIDPQEGPEYLKIRENLLKQEFLIAFQELMEPEKYLNRAVKMNIFEYGFPEKPEEALLKLRTSALSILSVAIVVQNMLGIKVDNKFHEKLAENILNDLNREKNYNQNPQLVANSISLLARIFDFLKTDDQNKIKDCAYKIYNHSDIKMIKDSALKLIQISVKNSQSDKEKLKEIEQEIINKYNTGDKSEKINNLLALIEMKSPQAETITTNLLNDDNCDPELKRTAVWAAGKYKNDSNFKLLCKLVNPDELANSCLLTSDEIEFKELVLYSIAEYNNKESIKVLQEVADSINKNKSEAVKQSLSSISELSEVLIDRLETKNYLKKDFCINKNLNFLDNDSYLKEKKVYEELRNKYIPDFNTLSPDLQNYIDNVLVPFRNLLEDQVVNNKNIYITDDMVTSIAKEYRGKITSTQQYMDNAAGLNASADDNDNIIIPFKSVRDPFGIIKTIYHELGHGIHFYIIKNRPEIAEKVQRLYNKALEKDNFLDFYSKTNVKEYFAQSNEAYLSIYKPHSSFAIKDDRNLASLNTRSRLRRKDPEMFKLLDDLYKENMKVNLTN